MLNQILARYDANSLERKTLWTYVTYERYSLHFKGIVLMGNKLDHYDHTVY